MVIKETGLNDADYLTRIQKRSSKGVEPNSFYEEEPGIESPFLNVRNMHRSIDFSSNKVKEILTENFREDGMAKIDNSRNRVPPLSKLSSPRNHISYWDSYK